MHLSRPQFVAPHPSSSVARLEPITGLVRSVVPIPSDLAVQNVADRFADDPSLDALPVVDDGIPVGLVTRTKLSRMLFARFGMALFERRPIRVLLESSPLVVSATDSIVAVLERAIKRPADDVYDDVVAVDAAGAYAGVVDIQRLVLEQGDVLARMVVARELADARAKELEDLANVKSKFLAHVTHELRSPVNTIVGLAELVEASVRAGDGPRTKEYVALIAKSSTALRQLVNNVLDLAKIESGRMVARPCPFAVDELVLEVAEGLRVLVRGKPVDVRVEVVPESATFVADPVMLRHVLANLGTNAAKFTEDGSVLLRAVVDAERATFEVTDTGIGIEPFDVERLFEPFVQAADVATRRYEGTGLGLAIVKQLVSHLQGRIDVVSEVGKGSTFRVTLPATPLESSE